MLKTKTRTRYLLAAVTTTVTAISIIAFSSLAWGDDDDDSDSDDDSATVINTGMSRVSATVTSGDGVSTVLNDCGGGVEGWNGGIHGVEPAASAKLKVTQGGGSSKVQISVRRAVPNTVFTVWLRMKGNNVDDNGNVLGPFGGSPLTGGGATPLAPGSALDRMISYSPFFPGPTSVGTANPTNGFTTNRKGNGSLRINLDFPVVGGAYPFDKASDEFVAVTITGGPGTPTAVVDPSRRKVGGPFMVRLVSHCQDNLAHGLSPGKRETWFQYP